MDHELATVLQAACYSAAAFGSIYAVARYVYLINKSDNDMMDDQNGEIPAAVADEKQSAPEATPVPAPESVEPQKPEGDEPAAS